MMRKAITLVVSSVFLASTALANTSDANDFEILCTIFSEAIEFNAKNVQLRSDYISDQIDTRVSSKEVAEIYYGLFNIAPEERYPLLVEAANHYTNEEWSCLPAKQLMN